MQTAVIIPAAGAGRRFGGADNKIFSRLGGRAVFLRTLELFVNRPDVCQVLLVASQTDLPTIRSQYGGEAAMRGVELVAGGASRAESVRNALARLDERAELVAIHDAVRPCLASAWVDRVLSRAAESGAAILAYPLHGTLKRVGSGAIIEQTLPREGLWQAQTPQVFRRELIVRAYAGEVAAATDDAQLVEAMGHPVSIVMGDPRNIKITTPADLALAEAVIESIGA